MPIDNERPLKDAYVIVPLYIVSVNSNDLPISCGEWELIDKTYLHENYVNKIMSPSIGLKEDIAYPMVGSVVTRPFANYFLIKAIKLFDGYTEIIDKENDNIVNRENLEVDFIITACRLRNKGRVQINRAYICSINSQSSRRLATSALLDNIKDSLSYNTNEWYRFDSYLLDKNSLQQALDFLPAVENLYSKLQIPLHYFNKYFASSDLYDMIINLSIIWEATILNGRDNNLKKTLISRGAYLFGSKCGDILKLAYEVRSEIVHTGDITNNTLKKMKKTIGREHHPIGLIFYFIKDYLEPITRDIINYFIRELGKDKNLTAQKIADRIESEMVAKLGRGVNDN